MERAVEALAAFALNAVWQSTLVVIAVVAVDSLFAARRPRVRYAVLVAAALLAVVIPLVTTFVPVGEQTYTIQTPVARTPLVSFLAALQAMVIVVVLARLFIRWRRTVALVGSSQRHRAWLRIADVPVPLTAGVLRPVILVPRYLLGDRAVMRAVVRHEIAHIRRLDAFFAIALDIITAPLACHPAMHILLRRLAEAREMCCDAAAGRRRAEQYIRSLITVARLATTRRDCALAMAGTTSIERRIDALRRPRKSGGLAVTAAMIVASMSLFIIGCRYAVHPSADLSGTWILDRAGSDFGRLSNYSDYRQTIVQRGNRISVDQLRRDRRGARRVSWEVVADGVARPVPGIRNSRGTARWAGDQLVLALEVPGHVERGRAFVHADRLVCEGTVQERGVATNFRAVFRRAAP